MATFGEVPGGKPSPHMDYAEHESTYQLFTFLVKWGTVSVVCVLVLMAVFLI